MKIYSIKEIVEATNNILNRDNDEKSPEFINKKKLENKTEVVEEPLILNNEILKFTKNNISSINHRISIKNEIKDKIVNEIYDFLKKKIKKNTLKIIIDEQIEIKNLRNEIDHLKTNKKELLDNYNNLKKRYDLLFDSYEFLKLENQNIKLENTQLKSNNNNLNNQLIKKDNANNELILENTELTKNSKDLQINLSKISGENSILSDEIKDLKSELSDKDLYLENTNQKNRSYEINNAELKNTVSRYIVNTKKLQEKVNYLEQSSQTDISEKNNKIKFYQDENVRLSSELLLAQKNSDAIRVNLSDIEIEKEKISNKIRELNRSIEEKTNVISTKFSEEKSVTKRTELENLNDKEQKSLDEVVKRIFQKL